MPTMDFRKAHEVAADFEREGKRFLQLAADMREAIKRAQNGRTPGVSSAPARPHKLVFKRKLRRKAVAGHSLLAVAVDILSEKRAPMHVKELLPLVIERKGRDFTRASVEGAISRGVIEGKVLRTAPSTFAVE